MEENIFKTVIIGAPNSLHNFLFINFCDIPPKFAKESVIPVCVHFGSKYDKKYYTSLIPNILQINKGHIGLSHLLAAALGIHENNELLLSFLKNITSLSSVSVRPASESDYTIMLNSNNFLENTILNQIRVVAPNQSVILKMGNISINIIIENLNPDKSCGILEQFTEMVVLDSPAPNSSWFQKLIFPDKPKTIQDILIESKRNRPKENKPEQKNSVVISEQKVSLVPSFSNFKKLIKLNENTLIVGPTGVGKSSILNSLRSYLEGQNKSVLFISCKNLRGKKTDSLWKMFLEKFPNHSVILLDDLDSLFYSGNENDNLFYTNRIANLLSQLIQSSESIFIATSANLENLGPIKSIRGPRIFELVLSIPNLTKNDRFEFLKENLKLEKIEERILEKTEGFRMQDLVDLGAKTRLIALQSGRQEILEGDVNGALLEVTPLSLMGIKLKNEMGVSWEDVGGLDEVKRVLEEVFMWPAKYPKVFELSPLPLQTGVLLYGAPGCGKTLLAAAIASTSQLNFISIKGPELLSKYVGASEAAVRDLFDRAFRAQPCLLFFDELDSLAPKRGNDSTGVTDRVVNQLLTQLDGVEGRSGVWVLGATSRPDLIDSALLRPGRFDRSVWCRMPNKEERLHILKVLGTKLTVQYSEDDFKVVAQMTEGYTGADLQALLSIAQLKCFREDSSGALSRNQLLAAVNETPYLLEKDRIKYEKIYRRFTDTRSGKNIDDEVLNQKLTYM